MTNLRDRLLHADVTAAEFGVALVRIPWHRRFVILAVAPLFGLIEYLIATRESIGKHLSLEDVPSSDAGERNGPPGLEQALGASRDAKIIAALDGQVTAIWEHQEHRCAVWSAHMKAVTDLLLVKFRYRVMASEWLEVFGYVDA